MVVHLQAEWFLKAGGQAMMNAFYQLQMRPSFIPQSRDIFAEAKMGFEPKPKRKLPTSTQGITALGSSSWRRGFEAEINGIRIARERESSLCVRQSNAKVKNSRGVSVSKRRMWVGKEM